MKSLRAFFSGDDSKYLERESAFYNDPNYQSDETEFYENSSNKNFLEPLRFIIIRHGERVDVTFGGGWTRYAFNSAGRYYPFAPNMPPSLPYRRNCFDFDVDTPLTANGLKQAWNVGHVLAQYNLPITACYSSPAFRSIQTADCILQGMARKDIVPLRIELGLFECSSWYLQNPIIFMSDDELTNGGINVDRKYHSQIRNLRLLENEYQYYERSKEVMKKLVKTHRKYGGNILLVGHAPSLEVLTRHLMNGQARPERLAQLSAKVDYCSMTIVEADPSTNTWQYRYSLDDRENHQRHQEEQYKKSLVPVYQSSSSKDLANSSAGHFQFFPQQEAYPPYFVV